MSESALCQAFWREHWIERISAQPSVASGRESYGDEETEILVADAIKALALHHSDSLLDIGCAKGLMGRYLQRVSRYVGMDYIKGFRPLVVGDAIRLPFRDATFDKTLLSGVLVCIPREWHWNVLSEMRRVTKPGGRGFVSGNLREYVHRFAHVFDAGELARVARECGWARAWVTQIDPRLEQARDYFDMVVE